ncbi:uncharacterized protein FIBRA_07578 [Fibroporia radiculosa]|uniref:ubiquitinyl hydrolase 1 n=1 Tax=Fibroporia radiculosa TaxID=599839 RepID=J4GEY8_9APHY|nr:uncharacterized protein FIBRA_07578 [Fibroporia radiculosa]CCM05363.1 predicted protein [Fibroporia radiculosa]
MVLNLAAAIPEGNYFTAPDLSAIARSLDEQEAEYEERSHDHDSANMDDTGFFSVQVLERALQVWGLTLVRWRSETMRPYQDHPHTQIAFILNLQQHWFTLRRFGALSSNPSIDADQGMSHWFNLNSFLQAPEWISKLYLGMVLQQAEAEGYSVFAIVQENPNEPISLPRSQADDLAAAISEPSSRPGAYLSTTRTPPPEGASRAPALAPEGFEDEDMELQAALQASLLSGTYGSAHSFSHDPAPVIPPPIPSSTRPVAGGTPTRRHAGHTPPMFIEEDEDEDEDEEIVEVDPIAASMARNRAFLQRMQREQEMALREGYQEELARGAQRGHAPEGDEDEDEAFRRALAESEAMAQAQRGGPDEGGRVDDLDDEPPVVPPRISPPQPPSARSQHRVYDDEDAELQAALRASLESMPEGFQMPETPPPRAAPPLPSPGASTPSLLPPLPAPALVRQPSIASESEGGFETESEAEQPPVEQLSMEEIRRRRLARFGG